MIETSLDLQLSLEMFGNVWKVAGNLWHITKNFVLYYENVI